MLVHTIKCCTLDSKRNRPVLIWSTSPPFRDLGSTQPSAVVRSIACILVAAPCGHVYPQSQRCVCIHHSEGQNLYTVRAGNIYRALNNDAITRFEKHGPLLQSLHYSVLNCLQLINASLLLPSPSHPEKRCGWQSAQSHQDALC